MRRVMLISLFLLPILPFVLGVILSLREAQTPRLDTSSSADTCQSLPGAITLTPCLLSLDNRPDGLSFYLNSGDYAPDLDVTLSLHTPAGTLFKRATTNGQTLHLYMPYVRAGLLPYTLRIGSEELSGQLQLQAGEAISPLDLNIGARMARVTGDHAPALVLHPLDEHQNVTAAPITVTTIAPNQEVWQQRINVEHLLAWTLLPVPAQTGTLQVIAQVGDARGERGEVDLLAGTAASSRIEIPSDRALASGRDVWDVQLLELKDALNNPVEDGTALNTVGSSGDIDFFLTRPSIQAEQRLVLPSYPQAGSFTFSVQSGAYQSSSWQLTSHSFGQAIPYRWLSAQDMELGPIVGPYGALLDDGTPVALSVLNQTGEVIVAWQVPLQDGRALVTLPPLTPEAVRLHVALLGEELLFNLP